jgi:hypothetical protein
MTPLQYMNREMHSGQSRRLLHEPRKPDLQRLSREARLHARKQRMRNNPEGRGPVSWLEERLEPATAIRQFISDAACLIRQNPLAFAAGAAAAGVVLGLCLRRR